MAISDQSIYNNYIARTLVKPSAKEFTSGTMPDDVKVQIETRVAQAVKDNDGVTPNDLYGEIAEVLSPYVGMDTGAITGTLKSNGIFGMVKDAASVKTVGTGLKKQQDLYNKKQAEIGKRTTAQFATAEDEGLLNSAARVASGAPTVRAMSDGPAPPAPEIVGPPGPGESSPPPVEIGVDEIAQSGTYVSSVEELEYEMGSTDRKISEIIVHWSETFQNANLNGQQLEVVTGAGSRKYHYIIKRDGTVERGVPIKQAGSHTRGHNSYSIGICLVGGLKVPSHDLSSNSSRLDLYDVGAESLTRGQYNTLHEIFRVFFTQYPGGQALGHSEVDVLENDPGFEVRDYVYNLFNKQSLYLDPANEGEKSPDEVLAAIDGDGPTVNDKDNTLLDQKF